MIKYFCLPVVIMLLFCGCGKEGPRKSVKTKPIKTKVKTETPKPVPKAEKKETEEGSFGQIQIRNWQNGTEIPKVKINRRNITKVEIPDYQRGIREKAGEGILPTPEKSLAARVKDQEYAYRWQPLWQFDKIPAPRLPAAEISPDASVLAIVETLGEIKGPFGSRIIFINTYNWKIIRVVEFEKKFISKICFVPNTEFLVMWSEVQKEIKEPARLLQMNCVSGEIEFENTSIRESVSALLCDGFRRRLLVKVKDSGKVRVFNAENIQRKPEIVKFKVRKGPIAFSADNAKIAIAGDGCIEIADFYSNGSHEKIKLPSGFFPDAITYCGSNDYIAASQFNGRTYFFIKDNYTEIANFSGNILEYNYRLNTLIAEIIKNNELKFFSVPKMKKTDSFMPGKIKPVSKGKPILLKYLPFRKKYALLDDHGNLSVVYHAGRKWKKIQILEPMK